MNKISYISLIIILAIYFGSCEKVFLKEPANNPEAIFEDLWQTFDEQYAPFQERTINWEVQYDLFRPRVNDQTTTDELFNVLSEMLASLDDGHVTLTAPNRDVFFSNYIREHQIDDSLFNLSVVKNHYLEKGYREAKESYVYGKIENTNLGYIFFDHVGPNFNVLPTFLEKHAATEGIIIDLRHNKGGDFTYSFSAMGKLTNEKRLVFKSKTKNGPGKNDYTSWHSWYLEPEGKFIDKPIVVLTDRFTISAGERTVMALKSLPNVKCIGDTTNGAHGTMVGRELANGWFYSLVPQKTEMFDGKSYEGIGLAPDVFFKNDIIQIREGRDATLERAIVELQ